MTTSAIILTTLGAVLSAFFTVIFSKIFAAYNPDAKKINSGIKKSLVFALRYVLPIANLIYVYAEQNIVDKYLVFITAFSFFILLTNVFIDIIIKIFKRINSSQQLIEALTESEKLFKPLIENQKNIVELLKDNSRSNKEFSDQFIRVLDVEERHLKLTNNLFTIISKDQNDEEKQQPT